MSLARFCDRCKRLTMDGNLWCQDKDCPAEQGFPVFAYGDTLSDLKVTKLITVWRTGALYEALRGKQTVWLKVAHADPECEDRLKREAAFLEAIGGLARKPSLLRSLRPDPYPVHLKLLPPYPTPSKRHHGEISFRGEPRVFTVLQPVQGSLLSDRLLETPQVWHYEAAWVAVTLARALRPLASRNVAHLSLAPNLVMVDVDAEGHWHPTLLDFGWLWDGSVDGAYLEGLIPRFTPAYAAPEVLAGRGVAVGPASDTYSLGLILYEMLAGRPAFEPYLKRDDQVRRVVAQNPSPPAIDRPELEASGVVKMVSKAISPTDRYPSVLQLAKALTSVYGSPPETRPLPAGTKVLLAVAAATLLCTVGFAAYLLLQVLANR
ncbi:MAG TPA: protein kinase [Anaerolineales bacterium]|nr:protein kinase [Anaerolineales bacterium]